MKINIYFDGFWSGFLERTNPVNSKFFIELFKKVYDTEDVNISSFNEANILVENTQIQDSNKYKKKWLHTYLFSGESYIRSDLGEYTCVLYGQRNHKNIVNVPLYLPYLICSFNQDILNNKIIEKIPEKDVIVIISNPSGSFRNKFLEKLENNFKVDYGGNYKNNIGGVLQSVYNSKEFNDFISKYKFIISMENSEEDTYITEKIIHGFLSGSIPVYWGSKRITDYFNGQRFINVRNEDEIEKVINNMKNMSSEDWLKKINSEIQTEFGKNFNLNKIAKDIKNVLNKKYNSIDQIYCITNEIFETERYNRIKKMLNDNNFRHENITFLCKTYKHTISDEVYKNNIYKELTICMRSTPTNKAELSLTLNFKEIFNDIIKNYKDGLFLILESDVIIQDEIEENFFNNIKSKKWDCLSLGWSTNEDLYNRHYNEHPTSYREFLNSEKYIEEINNDTNDRNIMLRKFHTRCTDSLLFTYDGIKKILNYMTNLDKNVGIPFDYYLSNFLETDLNFKFYWSIKAYFNQLSNMGLIKSTIK